MELWKKLASAGLTWEKGKKVNTGYHFEEMLEDLHANNGEESRIVEEYFN